MGNVTPLISIEGTEIVSDQRRGRNDVYTKSAQGILNCVDAKLLTGVATSLCQTNIDDLLREEWLDKLIDLGVMYAWYHTYCPVGPEPNEQLCLTPEQQLKIRKFVVEMRAKKLIAMIDAYYMHDGQALCPASTGISYHISSGRDRAVPDHSIRQGKHPRRTPHPRCVCAERVPERFSRNERRNHAWQIMLERPDKVKEFVEKHDAPDGTARGTALLELEAMNTRPSQWNRVEQVPEQNWIYKSPRNISSATSVPTRICNTTSERVPDHLGHHPYA